MHRSYVNLVTKVLWEEDVTLGLVGAWLIVINCDPGNLELWKERNSALVGFLLDWRRCCPAVARKTLSLLIPCAMQRYGYVA